VTCLVHRLELVERVVDLLDLRGQVADRLAIGLSASNLSFDDLNSLKASITWVTASFSCAISIP
jgi:hypothetical protein